MFGNLSQEFSAEFVLVMQQGADACLIVKDSIKIILDLLHSQEIGIGLLPAAFPLRVLLPPVREKQISNRWM